MLRTPVLVSLLLFVSLAINCGGEDDQSLPSTPADGPAPEGMGESGGSLDPTSCPAVSVTADPVIPTVMFLIDGSGSMNNGFGGTSRWNAVKDTLTDPSDGVLSNLDGRIPFGATVYHSLGGNAGGTCPILASESAVTGNSQAIGALLDGFSPTRDTPTAESVDNAVANFPAADGPRILVLATDGSPDSCEDPNDHSAATQANSEAAVQDAFAQGIETFVLSVGDDVTETHLQRLANAGQGADLDAGTETYYVANNPEQLTAGFLDIIRGARGCAFDLGRNITSTQAANGTVTLDGNELEMGVDWQLRDAQTVELIGDTCTDYLGSGQTTTLDAVFPCAVVVL